MKTLALSIWGVFLPSLLLASGLNRPSCDELLVEDSNPGIRGLYVGNITLSIQLPINERAKYRHADAETALFQRIAKWLENSQYRPCVRLGIIKEGTDEFPTVASLSTSKFFWPGFRFYYGQDLNFRHFKDSLLKNFPEIRRVDGDPDLMDGI